jgi:hypothetical protein
MNPKSLNRYAFAADNPIRYNDPTGHAWYDWLLGVIVIIVIVVAVVALTVLTYGAFSGVLCAILIGAIIGAGVGAAGMGVYALTRGASVFSSDFWMAMAGGAVIGAAIGIGLAVLPASIGIGLPAGAAGFFASLAADVFIGAVLGGLGPITAHLATGGGPEDILTKKIGYDIATAVIKGAIFGLITGGLLGYYGMGATTLWTIVTGAGSVLLTAEGIWEASKSAYAPKDTFSLLLVFGTDTNWFNNSPTKRLGIPSWAFAGTWAGSGRSEWGGVLQTMPLTP